VVKATVLQLENFCSISLSIHIQKLTNDIDILQLLYTKRS